MANYSLYNFLCDFQYTIPDAMFLALNVFTPMLQRFPAELTTEIVFETRLHTNSSQIDLSVSIEHAKRLDFAALIDAQFMDDWGRLHEFTNLWASPLSGYGNQVGKLWLTFDGVASRANRPSLYLGANYTNPVQPEELRWKDHPEWLLTTAIPLFWEQAVTEQTAKCLKTCLAFLPETMPLPMIGLMIARRERFIRLLLPDFPREKVIPFLKKIHWPGSINEINVLLVRYATRFERITVQLDIADQVLPQLGIEGYQAPLFTKVASRWDPIFSQLIADNLCSTDKKDQVFSFLGASKTYFPFKAEPMFVGRTIRHMKFLYRLGAALEVKAYPAFVLLPFD